MPVVGVIDPGVRAVLSATRNQRVGVIGTVGTVGVGRLPAGGGRHPRAGPPHVRGLPGLRRVRRAGETDSEQVHVLAERLLAPVRQAGVDTLLLGCTHYPFLARTIGDVMGRDVVLVSSADETAFEVRAILEETGLVRRSGHGTGKGRHTFASSGDVEWFKRLGARLLGPEVDDVEAWAWPD